MVKEREAGRRRSPRLTIQLDGSLSGRQPRTVKVLNVSLTGCLVQVDALLEPGAILDLKLKLDPDPFTAKVRVVNSCLDGASVPGEKSRYLAGMVFLGSSVQEQTSLRRFLEEERRRRRSADTSAD